MGKTSHQTIENKLNRIQELFKSLKNGTLNLEGIEELSELCTSVNESFIILKYKAFENYVKGMPSESISEESIPEEKTAEEPQSISIEFDPTDSEKTEEVNREESFAFDFSEPIQEKSVSDQEELFEDEPRKEAVEFETEDEEDEIADNSLNNKFKSEEDFSLRKKLGRTPIKDLKSEIGIAKKFEYINLMFSGKAEIYEEAINSLNTCENNEHAKTLLHRYSSEYHWDLEDKTIIKFIELVERRYL